MLCGYYFYFAIFQLFGSSSHGPASFHMRFDCAFICSIALRAFVYLR